MPAPAPRPAVTWNVANVVGASTTALPFHTGSTWTFHGWLGATSFRCESMATCVALTAPHSKSSCSVELSATHHAESPARKPAPWRVKALGTPTTASTPRSHSVGLNRAVSMPRIPTTATAKLGCSNHGSEPNLWQRLHAGNPCTGVPTNEGDTTRPAIPTPIHHSLLGPNTAVAFIIDPSTAVDTDTSCGVSHPHPHGPAGTNRVASLPEAPTTDT